MHQHCNHHHRPRGQRGLIAAVALNLLLTVVQIVGGMLSGSLALMADALHNFSDCASLVIALVARQWSQRRADRQRTFGYQRAEVVGAMINLTALVMIAFYLIIEAVGRLLHPQPVEGWTVIAVAAVALVVDLATVGLVWATGKTTLNMRAALLHNLTDAMASVAVIVAGAAILWWEFYLADVIATLLIAVYVMWHSGAMLRQTIGILMNSAPAGIDVDRLVAALCEVEGVRGVHHLHVWRLDEFQVSLEAHVVIGAADAALMEPIKQAMKEKLAGEFEIEHSTLEFELDGETACVEPEDTELIPEH